MVFFCNFFYSVKTIFFNCEWIFIFVNYIVHWNNEIQNKYVLWAYLLLLPSNIFLANHHNFFPMNLQLDHFYIHTMKEERQTPTTFFLAPRHTLEHHLFTKVPHVAGIRPYEEGLRARCGYSCLVWVATSNVWKVTATRRSLLGVFL